MFVPTIKYRRVNDHAQDLEQAVKKLDLNDTLPLTKPVNTPASLKPEETKQVSVTTSTATTTSSSSSSSSDKTAPAENEPKKQTEEKSNAMNSKDKEKQTQEPKDQAIKVTEAEAEATITVDPLDEDRIVVTLSNGTKYTADRYCPHAGADLSYLGEVAEDEYPPEIGPILLCTLHYWEFALEKGGRAGGGWASLNACPAGECPIAKDTKLEW